MKSDKLASLVLATVVIKFASKHFSRETSLLSIFWVTFDTIFNVYEILCSVALLFKLKNIIKAEIDKYLKLTINYILKIKLMRI